MYVLIAYFHQPKLQDTCYYSYLIVRGSLKAEMDGEEGLAQNFSIFNPDPDLARQYYSYMTRLEHSLELLP